jgi:hypothetical protein
MIKLSKNSEGFKMILIHKDIDGKIGSLLIGNCNIVSCKLLNQIMNTFKDYEKLVDGLYSSFTLKFCKNYGIAEPYHILLIAKFIKLNMGSFYTKALLQFAMQKDVIIFDGGQRANTRRTLYMLGMFFGYRYTITKQERYEKTHNRSRHVWAENKIGKYGEYTMRELIRLKVDWGNDYKGIPSWLPTGRFTDKNDKKGSLEELWEFNPESCFCKRGIMVNGPGVLRFFRANVISIEESKKRFEDIKNFLKNKKENK